MNANFTSFTRTCNQIRAFGMNLFMARDFRRVLGGNAGRCLLTMALALTTPVLALAQASAVRPRVTDRVDTSSLTVLQGNTHPLARTQYDQGSAPPNLPMNRMLLVLKRSAEQEAALQQLLQQQQQTSSPNYHVWLTPDQFGQQFGPADSDIQAVTSWLSSYGFQSIQVSKGRSTIEFSGTAAQVESGLHTSIHRYLVNGESHWANASDPEIPTALAPVIAGVLSLNDFKKKKAFVKSDRKAIGTISPGERPSITFSDGTHGMAPADFNTIYNVGSTMNGAGATIAIVSDTDINVQDVSEFRSIFGLPVNNPQTVLNGPDPGDIGGNAEAEAVLDVTWAGAVAPSANVILVASEDTNDADGVDLSELYIVDYNLADVMTESILACEAQDSSAATFYSGLAEQAAAQGITYLVASGDGGPDGCDDFSTIPGTDTPASVNLLAATPFNVAVGGTEFNDISNPGTYWNATNGTNLGSVKSYIPENVWNESCTEAQCGANLGLWSSGGGQSAIFSKPVWQSGVAGIPSANSRFLPDVALTAALHDGYVLCLDGSCQGSNPEFGLVGGTSASVQAFGGVMALVVQKTGQRQGQANYVFYKLAANESLGSCNGSNTSTPLNNSTGNCIFNDTTSGNTNIPGETGFAAGVGYDEATGLGSVNVSNLVNQWNSVRVDGSTTTLSLNGGNPVNITHGAAVPVSISVAAQAPATGTPTGDVSLISTSSSWQGTDGFTLSNGSVSSSTILLPGGTYTVEAHYEGDGTFTGSTSSPPINVIVNPEPSLTGVAIIVGTPCTATTSVIYGSAYVLSGGVTDSEGEGTVCLPSPVGSIPSGTVTLTDTFNGITSPLDGGSFKLNSAGYFEDQSIQLPAGTHSIQAAYSGDNSYAKSTSNLDVVTVQQASTSTTISANQTAVAAGASVALTATVSTSSNGVAPTGTVSFFANGAAITTGTVSYTRTNGSLQGPASVVATLNYTPTATTSITAMYNAGTDPNYLSSAVSGAVTLTVTSTSTFSISSPNNSTATAVAIAAPGGTGTSTLTVTSVNSFAGTVTLTCSVAPIGSANIPPTCSFPGGSTVTLTANSTKMPTVMLSTTASSSVGPSTPTNYRVGPIDLLSPGTWIGAAILAILALGSVVRVPRRLRGYALLVLLLLLTTIGVVACGGGGASGEDGGGSTGTTTGVYVVNISGTSGSTTATPISVYFNLE